MRTATYQLTGTAEPGSAVTLSRGADTFGPVTADAGGAWTLLVTLVEGPNTFTATAKDAAGNASTASAGWTVTADTTAPVTPVVTAPASGTVTRNTAPVVSGTAEAGTTVTVLTAAGATLGTTAADGSGRWILSPAGALPEGPSALYAVSADAAGNQSTSAQVLVTVDSQAPAAPGVTTPQDGSSAAVTATSVTGTGEPGATVAVVVDGTSFGTTTVDAAGRWTVTGTLPAAVGPHSVAVAQTDAAGNTSLPTTVRYTVTAPANTVSVPVVAAPTGTSLETANMVRGSVSGALPGDNRDGRRRPRGRHDRQHPHPVRHARPATGAFAAPVTLGDGGWIVTATHTSGADTPTPARPCC